MTVERSASPPPRARGPTASSACASSSPARRRAACSNAAAASGSTRVLEDPEIDQQAARRLGVHSALFVPLVVHGRPIGVVIAHDKAGPTPAFTDDDLRLAEALAARAASAVDLSQRVSRDVVGRVVAAQELERKRLARELHDETGQALTSILLGLKPLERALAGRRGPRRGRRRSASSSSRRSRTCAGSRSSCGPRRSTTSGSSRRSSASPRRSGSRPASRVDLESQPAATSGCRARSRRRSTGSCRRR